MLLCLHCDLYIKKNTSLENFRESQSQATASAWHKEEERKDRNRRGQNKQTNAREAHRPAPSFSTKVITLLNRTKKKTKSKSWLNTKRPVVKTTKPHKLRTTPGHRLKTASSISYRGFKVLLMSTNLYPVILNTEIHKMFGSHGDPLTHHSEKKKKIELTTMIQQRRVLLGNYTNNACQNYRKPLEYFEHNNSYSISKFAVVQWVRQNRYEFRQKIITLEWLFDVNKYWDITSCAMLKKSTNIYTAEYWMVVTCISRDFKGYIDKINIQCCCFNL